MMILVLVITSELCCWQMIHAGTGNVSMLAPGRNIKEHPINQNSEHKPTRLERRSLLRPAPWPNIRGRRLPPMNFHGRHPAHRYLPGLPQLPRQVKGLPAGRRVLPHDVMEALPGAISRVMQDYGRLRTPPTTTTTTEPPVIWFPNQQEECENSEGGGGGFSTFSLLALLMSGVNLVGILAANANNNLNNNNNDNNINNNIVQDGNENNANNNANVFTMITTGMGKKKRRRRWEGEVEEEEEKNESGETVCWKEDENEIITGEEVASVVSLAFLKAYLQAGMTGNVPCLARSLCLANQEAADWGDLAVTIAEVLSVSHMHWVSRLWPEVSLKELEEAGQAGRSEIGSRPYCGRRYRCTEGAWARLTHHHTLMGAFIQAAGHTHTGTPVTFPTS